MGGWGKTTQESRRTETLATQTSLEMKLEINLHTVLLTSQLYFLVTNTESSYAVLCATQKRYSLLSSLFSLFQSLG